MINLYKGSSNFELFVNPAKIVYSGGEPYSGAYEITPKVDQSVVLNTKNKVLAKDVTVKKIPQFEVSNEANGKTLIIGEEYYG